MVDWHEEVGKRLINIEVKLGTLIAESKSFKERFVHVLDELRDEMGVLIENHKLLFEVFPYMRGDIDSVLKHLAELLMLAKEYATGIEPEIYG